MMNKKEIFRKIGVIIAELNEQYQYLSANPESLNDLELELFGANADFLAEHVKVLKKITETAAPEIAPVSADLPSQAPAATPTQPESSAFAEPAPAPELPVMPPAPAPATGQVTEPDKPSLHEQITERIEEIAARTAAPEAELQPVANEIPQSSLPEQVSAGEAPVVTEVVIPEKVTRVELPTEPVAGTAGAQATAPAPTINDLMSAQVANSQATSSLLSSQPVKDLKSVISLNDKLLFIKDLFNGYSLAYSEAVELVNRFDSFEAADNFLKTNYAAKNHWASKPATVDKFYEVLNRRFSKQA